MFYKFNLNYFLKKLNRKIKDINQPEQVKPTKRWIFLSENKIEWAKVDSELSHQPCKFPMLVDT